jgi:transposase
MAGLHGRVERGLAIATGPGQIEEIAPNVWSVPSQSGRGVYLVSLQRGVWRCICPDYTAHSFQCKHIVGVQLRLNGLSRLEATEVEAKRPRPTYRQNWPAYNAAQRSEAVNFGLVLQDLVSDLEDPCPPKPTGRPRLPYPDIVYCTVEREFTRLPLRKAQGTYSGSQEAGRISCVPSDNIPSMLLRRADTSAVLNELIARSAAALTSIETTFAVDSSGFRTTSFGEYCREKYGATVQNIWWKLHIIVGTQTGIIPAVVVTEGHAADTKQFPALIEAVAAAGFTVAEVYADKGYLAGENFTVVAKAGGIPYIMFRENSRGRAKQRRDHAPWWKKMWHLLQTNPTEFLKHYYMRENVEATFAAIKKKLGETLSSRDPTAQVNELLCKVLVHNIQILIQASFERGIPLPGMATRHGTQETVHPDSPSRDAPANPWDLDAAESAARRPENN